MINSANDAEQKIENPKDNSTENNDEIKVSKMSNLTCAYWVWVLGSFGVIIIAAFIESIRWICVPVTGQLMAGLGLAFMFSSKKLRFKQVMFNLMFVVVGILLIVASIISKVKPDLEMPEYFVPGIGFFIGLCVIVFPIISYLIDCKTCTEEVDAVVIDLIPSKGSEHRTYTPLYRYRYNGKDYEVHNSSYSNSGNPHIDEQRTLYIDPNDPETFFDKKRARSGIFTFFGIGMIFMVVCGIMLWVILFKN